MIARVQTEDRLINQLQSNIGLVVNPLQEIPLNQGVLIQNVSLTSGANRIPHGLGRPLIGWFVTRMRTVFRQIYDTDDAVVSPPNDTSLYLYLNSSGTVVCDLFIF